MSLAPVIINLKLTNQKVKFVGVSETNPQMPITFDFAPPIGDGEGFVGIESLSMSFAGCVSTGIVVLLRRAGKEVAGYSMHVRGIKREVPLSLEKIEFEITVESRDVTDEDVQAAIQRAEQISPVWMAIKNNVEVLSAYKIVRPV